MMHKIPLSDADFMVYLLVICRDKAGDESRDVLDVDVSSSLSIPRLAAEWVSILGSSSTLQMPCIGFRSRYAILPVSFVPRILANSPSTSLELGQAFTVAPCFNVLCAESEPVHMQQGVILMEFNCTGLPCSVTMEL